VVQVSLSEAYIVRSVAVVYRPSHRLLVSYDGDDGYNKNVIKQLCYICNIHVQR